MSNNQLWTVVVEYYRLDEGHVGEPNGVRVETIHTGRGVAALRHLGILIAGRATKPLSVPDNYRLYVRAADGTEYSYNQLREHLYGTKTHLAAVVLGARGGKRRAVVLDASRRQEIARRAANARWGNEEKENPILSREWLKNI